ncbi:MAG: BatD family protein [Candidatus Methanoperedens sp.]|nr:BatD family protein [Candidatus Methanoperedens sp.]MCZ7370874.1 BatD family protein [Candidatus Methanoperedens sp.]
MKRHWFLLSILLILSPLADASTQTYNFTMKNNTGLNFESGTFMVELIKIVKPDNYVMVNLTMNDSSAIRNIHVGEAPIVYNQLKLSMPIISESSAVLTLEFPERWSYPKTYDVLIPTLPVGVPNIVITRIVDKSNVNLGGTVEFKIRLENTGNATAYNLTLNEGLPNGFSNAPGSKFPPVPEDRLEPGEVQEVYYALKAVDSGTFTFGPSTITYGSKANKTAPIIITVAEVVPERSILTTVVTLNKNNINTDELFKVAVKITNIGKAPAESILVEPVDGKSPEGTLVMDGDLRQVYKRIYPGYAETYTVTLKAIEPGNYSVHLRTVYNDDTIGTTSESDNIVVAKKAENNYYLYAIVSMIMIVTGIVVLTIKRHKEYSY